jgi:hypothetical protein
MAGRPTVYTEKLAEKICFYISEGMSIRQVCSQEGMPDKSQVFRWLASNEEFRDRYAKAKTIGVEYLAEELIDIADDATNDYMESEGKDGSVAYKINGEAVNRSRLRIDTRKWVLAKLMPKKYGEAKEEGGSAEQIAAALKELAKGLPN